MTTVDSILKKKGGQVQCIRKEACVLEAAQRMNEQTIGALVVLDEDRVVGIITERDILRRIVAVQRDPARTQVREVMTWPVIGCHPQMDVSECRQIITEKRIRHLPVVQGDQLLGMVTSGDILALDLISKTVQIEYLNEYHYQGPAPNGDADSLCASVS